MALPIFKYHPDPIATGSIMASGNTCVCCGEARGYVYIGPVYAIEEYEECICPWCIADGSAHAKLDAAFNDEESIGGNRHWDTVPIEVIEEVAYRTPGFFGWQQHEWWTHCGDAAKYLGRVGRVELLKFDRRTIEIIREYLDYDKGSEWDQLFSRLSPVDSPTAYLFQCTKCGQHGGYWDCD